jgi:ATP-dependent exoDNAse (exonuclease V) beta subunit
MKKFVVYKSSAGSGKTYTLIREFLRICFASKEPMIFSRILAITFTNKAAEEMRERLVSSLESCHHGKPVPLVLDAAKAAGLSEEEAAEKGKQLLKNILDHYGSLAISTIDRFSHRLIRNFTFDLKLPAGFEVSLNRDVLLQEAVKRVIAKATPHNRIGRYMSKYAEYNSEESKKFQPEEDLYRLVRFMFNDSHGHLQKQFTPNGRNDYEGFHEHISHTLEKMYGQMRGMYNEYVKIRERYPEVLDDHLSYKTKGFPSYFAKFARPESFHKPFFNGHCEKMLDKDKIWNEAHAEDCTNLLRDHYRTCRNFIQDHKNELIAYPLIQKNLFLTALLREVNAEYQQLKKEEAVLPVSEFNEKISEVILNETAPFIFERIGQRFHHIMIDEFQDTSQGQWMNFLPLLENCLSEGYECLLVGDAKQSIYRWRGAESRQFSMLPALPDTMNIREKNKREEVLKSHYREEKLGTNFRSASGIVNFNNAFFTGVAERFLHHDMLDAAQKPGKNEERGFIRFLNEETDQPVSYYKNTCKELITELRTKNFNYRDIAILVRDNNLASQISAFLIHSGIPVVSRESLLIMHNARVSTLMHLLQCVLYPRERLYLVQFLENFAEATGEATDWAGLLEDRHPGVEEWLRNKGYSLDVPLLLKLPLYEKLIYLCSLFGWEYANDPFLCTLFEKALQALESGINSTRAFLRWWNEGKEKFSVVVPAELNAVQVMTIHKSKGLEFGAVIIPKLNWSTHQKNANLWIRPSETENPFVDAFLLPCNASLLDTTYAEAYQNEKNQGIKDHLNMLYVAFTRASEHLYGLMAAKKLPDFSKEEEEETALNIWKLIHRFFGGGEYVQGHPETFHIAEKHPTKATTVIGSVTPAFTQTAAATGITPVTETNQKTLRGTAFHKLFSRIGNYAQYLECKQNNFVNLSLNEEESKEWLAYIFEQSEAAPWLQQAEEQWCEPSLMTSMGEVCIPDRLIRIGEQWFVVDIKTGKPSPRHTNQMKQYLNAFEGSPYKAEKALLLYVENKESICVTR